jgi:hypothetical protein
MVCDNRYKKIIIDCRYLQYLAMIFLQSPTIVTTLVLTASILPGFIIAHEILVAEILKGWKIFIFISRDGRGSQIR